MATTVHACPFVLSLSRHILGNMSDETITAPDPSPSPAPEPAPPPAAVVVIHGQKTERELELEKQLELEGQKLKKAQMDAACAQDDFQRLKELQSHPAPAPAPPRSKRKGWTLFHEEED